MQACFLFTKSIDSSGLLLSQPFDVAKVFTGSDGVQVPLEKTISSFKAVVAGEYDHLPEAAFYMVGDIDDVIAKAQRLAAAAA